MESFITEHDPTGVQLLRFQPIADWSAAVHGFTLRTGGVSAPPCDSLNFSFQRESSGEAVRENFNRAAQALGVPYGSVVIVDQVHGNDVLAVEEQHKGSGLIKEIVGSYDAMVTNVPGITLCTRHGDCVPVFFWDKKQNVIGAAHSGWKGTAGKISAEVVRTMRVKYGCRTEDIHAAVGPCILQDCFEVGEEVYQKFAEAFPAVIKEETFAVNIKEKWRLSMPDFIRETLYEEGIRKEHILLSDICTSCRPAQYFSHRREQGRTGAMGAFIGLL